MQYRTLGRTGLRVSEVGCGGAPIGISNYNEVWDPHGDAETRSVIEAFRHAVDVGYNYFDTAPGYGEGRSEELIGLALDELRSRVAMATKTAWKGRTKEQIFQSVEGSLRRLRTDYLDVIQFHGGTGDPYMPDDFRWIMEGGPMDAFQQLKQEGKIRFVGITCEEPVSLRPFLDTGLFDVIQIKYNVIYQGAWHNALSWAQEANVGVVAMRPLTSGIFQKLMRAAWPAIEQHVDLNELALNFVLSDPRVATAIVGARRVSEIDANNALSDAVQKRFDLDWLQERRVVPPDGAASQGPATALTGR
jgi:aryl-alcohol dehydrogenase-like predicted oxidoreductase